MQQVAETDKFWKIFCGRSEHRWALLRAFEFWDGFPQPAMGLDVGQISKKASHEWWTRAVRIRSRRNPGVILERFWWRRITAATKLPIITSPEF